MASRPFPLRLDQEAKEGRDAPHRAPALVRKSRQSAGEAIFYPCRDDRPGRRPLVWPMSRQTCRHQMPKAALEFRDRAHVGTAKWHGVAALPVRLFILNYKCEVAALAGHWIGNGGVVFPHPQVSWPLPSTSTSDFFQTESAVYSTGSKGSWRRNLHL